MGTLDYVQLCGEYHTDVNNLQAEITELRAENKALMEEIKKLNKKLQIFGEVKV